MALLQILAAVGTYLLAAIAGMAILAKVGVSLKQGVTGQVSARQALVAAAVNAIIILLIGAEEIAFSGSLSGFRLHASGADVIIAAIGTFGTLGVARIYAGLSKFAPGRPTAGHWLYAATLLTLFLGALMEEVLFRAFIITRLARLGWLAALLVSTAIFTLIHLPTSRLSLRAVVAWFLGGVALGGAWLAGAPLVVVTLFHFARNVGNVLWVDPLPQLGLVKLRTTRDSSRIAYYAVISALVLALAMAGYPRLASP